MIGRARYPIQSSRPEPTGAEQMHDVLQTCSDDAVIRVYDEAGNVLLEEYVATIPQMRRRNPTRDPSKPYVYVGLTSLRMGRRFNFFRATSKYEWRVHKFGVRLMPEVYDSLRPMTCERALQTARELADDLRAKGFGVANGACIEAQSYKSILRRSNQSEP